MVRTSDLVCVRLRVRLHGFSFFPVKMFSGSVSVLLTSTSLKITLLKLAEATRETEHRSAMHSAPSTEV